MQQRFIGISILLLFYVFGDIMEVDMKIRLGQPAYKQVEMNDCYEQSDPPGLAEYLKYIHQQFDTIPAKFEAEFKGLYIGDYPHLNFEDKLGNQYDFGDGNNSYGKFKKKEIMNESSKYVGRMFWITWDWKMSTFYCCEGEMTLLKAKLPSIVKLELIK